MKRLLCLLLLPSLAFAEDSLLNQNVLSGAIEGQSIKIYEHDTMGVKKPFPSQSITIKDIDTVPKIEVYNHGVYGLKDYKPSQTILLPRQERKLNFNALDD